jgi:hypothetical protein
MKKLLGQVPSNYFFFELYNDSLEILYFGKEVMKNLKMLFAIVMLCISCQAFGVVDQSNSVANPWGTNGGGPGWAYYGQSFTPTLTGLDFVQFKLVGGNEDGSPVSMVVDILSGVSGTNGMEGAVLATSAPVSVVSALDGYAIYTFNFASTVSLVPGQVYVARVSSLAGNFGIMLTASDVYAGGQYLFSTEPYLYTNFYDAIFAEGMIPEPTTIAILAFGSLLLARKKK